MFEREVWPFAQITSTLIDQSLWSFKLFYILYSKKDLNIKNYEKVNLSYIQKSFRVAK